MPSKKVTESEMRWVPLAARRVCYSCGTFLENDHDKDNCRLCYDVFCTNCLREKLALPPHYGYTEKQPVCRVCVLLLRTFPTFGSRLHRGQGGMLLPPRVAVVVTSCDLPYLPADDPSYRSSPQPNTSSTSSSSAPAPTSWIGRLMQRLKGSSDKQGSSSSNNKKGSSASPSNRSKAGSPAPSHQEDLPSSYTRIPHKQLINPSAQRAVLMSLAGWRPMNPETTLCIGPISICVRDILKIYSGNAIGSSSSNGGSNGATVSSNNLSAPHSATPSGGGFASNTGRRLSAMFSGGGGAGGNSASSSSRSAGGGKGGKGGGGAHLSDGRVTIILQGGFSVSLIVGVTVFDRDSSPLIVRKKSSSTLDTNGSQQHRGGGGGSTRIVSSTSGSGGGLSDGEEYEADDPYCEMFSDGGILISSDTSNIGGGSRKSSRGSFGGGGGGLGNSGRRGSWLPGSSRKLDGVTTVDFTTDPKESAQLADHLVGLVRECREHFAFGRASLALHRDLVPE